MREKDATALATAAERIAELEVKMTWSKKSNEKWKAREPNQKTILTTSFAMSLIKVVACFRSKQREDSRSMLPEVANKNSSIRHATQVALLPPKMLVFLKVTMGFKDRRFPNKPVPLAVL